MFNQHFYHEKIRKCVAVFGTLFNNLYVLRKDSGMKDGKYVFKEYDRENKELLKKCVNLISKKVK